jgi:hypothetical protein
MRLDIPSVTKLFSASSIACVIPDEPKPSAKPERRVVMPFVKRFPMTPKMPDEEEPLLDAKPVGLRIEGKVMLGSGKAVAIALPPPAITLESCATAEDRAGIIPNGSRGSYGSLFSGLDTVIVVIAVFVADGVSLFPRPAALEVEVAEEAAVADVAANSMIPVPKSVVLN